MAARSEQSQHFSIDDANRMLPLVQRITADIVSLARDLDSRQMRLDSLVRDDAEADDPYAEEVRQMQQEIDTDEIRLDEYIAELADLGVELQDAIIGEVDFRTRIDGRPAFLCWKLGESEVAHWHTEEGGFEERLTLLQGASSAEGYGTRDSSDS